MLLLCSTHLPILITLLYLYTYFTDNILIILFAFNTATICIYVCIICMYVFIYLIYYLIPGKVNVNISTNFIYVVCIYLFIIFQIIF